MEEITQSPIPALEQEKFLRRDILLPKWDRRRKSYATLIFNLELKIEDLEQLMGLNKLICLGMLETLLENKLNCISSWLMRQAKDRYYDWREFLEAINMELDNKKAGLKAGEFLIKMRQGQHQYFDGFLQDFECQLSLCGGEKFGSASKLILLHVAIK